MAKEIDNNKAPSFTGDWGKDVGTWKNEKEKQRTHFYTQSALLSLRVDNESDIAEALRHPKENKISTLEEIKSGELSMHKIKEGEVLQSFLKRFYKNIKNGADKHRDLKVTLYELTKQQMNVDFIRAGNTVEIVNGEIIFYKGNGDELARYLLRQGTAAGEVKKVKPVVPLVVKKTPPVVARKPTPVDTPLVIVKRAKPRPIVEDDEPAAPLPIAKAPKPVAETPKPKPVAAPAPASVAKVEPEAPVKPNPNVVNQAKPTPAQAYELTAPVADVDGSFTVTMDPPAPKKPASSEPLEVAEEPAPVVVSAPADDGSTITVALDPAVTAELPHAEPAVFEPVEPVPVAPAIASPPPPSLPAPGASPPPAPATAGPSAIPMGMFDRVALINKIANGDYIKAGILDLTDLTTLDKEGAEALAKAPQLKSLWLNGLTTFDTEVAEVLAKAPQLKYLALNGLTTLDKGVAEVLAKAPQLKALRLNGLTTLDKGVAEALAKAPQLMDLDLNDLTTLDKGVAEALVKAPQLTSLFLNGLTTLDTEVAEVLAKAPQLRRVFLKDTHLSKSDLASLAGLAPSVETPSVSSQQAPAVAPALSSEAPAQAEPVTAAPAAIPSAVAEPAPTVEAVPLVASERKNITPPFVTSGDFNKYAEPLTEEDIEWCKAKFAALATDYNADSGGGENAHVFNKMIEEIKKNTTLKGSLRSDYNYGDPDKSLMSGHDRNQDRKFVQWILENQQTNERTHLNALIWLSDSYYSRAGDTEAERAPDFSAEKGRAFAEMALYELDNDPKLKNGDAFKHTDQTYEVKKSYAASLRAYGLAADGYQMAAAKQYKELAVVPKNEHFTNDIDYQRRNEYFNFAAQSNDPAILKEAKNIAVQFLDVWQHLSAMSVIREWWKIASDEERVAELPKLLRISQSDLDVFARNPKTAIEFSKIMTGKTTPFDKAPGNVDLNRAYWLLDIASLYSMKKQNLEHKKELYREAYDIFKAHYYTDNHVLTALQDMAATINQQFYNSTTFLRGGERGVQIKEKPNKKGERTFVVDLDYLFFDSERQIAIAQYVNKETHEFGKALVLSIGKEGRVSGTDTLPNEEPIDLINSDGDPVYFDPTLKKLVAIKEGMPTPLEVQTKSFAQDLESFYHQKVTIDTQLYNGNFFSFNLKFESPVSSLATGAWKDKRNRKDLQVGPLEAIFLSTSDGKLSFELSSSLGSKNYNQQGFINIHREMQPHTFDDAYELITGQKRPEVQNTTIEINTMPN